MIVTRAPMRVSFLGGGTDLPGFCKRPGLKGHTVSCAIDKFIYSIVNKRNDGKIRVSYSKLELVNDVKKLQHELIRALLIYLFDNNVPGIEIHTVADIPTTGSGLGSSAALLASVYLAVVREFSLETRALKDKRTFTQQIYEIEKYYLGRNVGAQDHAASVYGGLNHFIFDGEIPNRAFHRSLNAVDLRTLSRWGVLLNTNVERDANIILTNQSDLIDAKMPQYKEMASIAEKFALNVNSEQFEFELANAMNTSYMLKRNLSPLIENEKTAKMISLAKSIGTTAEKVCGAGGGGHLFLMCPPSKRGELLNAFEKEFNTGETKFNFTKAGAEVCYLPEMEN